MTLALSGLPQFISRVIAEQPDPQKQRAQIKSSIRMFLDSDWTMGNDVFFADVIARVMGDAGLASLIAWYPLHSSLYHPDFYRGSFQGNLQMVPTAVSQVVEQLLRVGVILVAASFFISSHGMFIRLGLWQCPAH